MITKLICLLIFFSISASRLTAQVLGNNDPLTLLPPINQNPVPKLLNPLYPTAGYTDFITSAEQSKKATLLLSNNKFDIYALPLDHMPCLVPNKTFSSKMKTMQQALSQQENELAAGKNIKPI